MTWSVFLGSASGQKDESDFHGCVHYLSKSEMRNLKKYLVLQVRDRLCSGCVCSLPDRTITCGTIPAGPFSDFHFRTIIVTESCPESLETVKRNFASATLLKCIQSRVDFVETAKITPGLEIVFGMIADLLVFFGLGSSCVLYCYKKRPYLRYGFQVSISRTPSAAIPAPPETGTPLVEIQE